MKSRSLYPVKIYPQFDMRRYVSGKKKKEVQKK